MCAVSGRGAVGTYLAACPALLCACWRHLAARSPSGEHPPSPRPPPSPGSTEAGSQPSLHVVWGLRRRSGACRRAWEMVRRSLGCRWFWALDADAAERLCWVCGRWRGT